MTVHADDFRIDRILEDEIPLMPAMQMIAGLTPELLAENRAWMQPSALTEDDQIRVTFQSFVVRTPHHTILIDSCVGNDKPRPRPQWDKKTDTRFMDGLAALGLAVEDIDYVLCTHLHVDHVGWNTRLQDGRWVPTFPKARYVFDRTEYAYWEGENAKAENAVFVDSVLPVVEAGRADLVAGASFGIGDHLRLLPTPGHTPGHVSVLLGRTGTEAAVSGDIIHSPVQARYPELSAAFDVDAKQSAVTRRAFLERMADTPTICCMTHFPSPSIGRIKRWGEGFRCDWIET